MKRYAIYAEADGSFVQSIDCEHTQIDGCVPPGHRAIEGVDLPHAKRLVGDELVEHQPAAPDADHEWVGRIGRWMLRADAMAVRAAKRAAQERIDVLEKQQARAVREERIGRGGTAAQLRKRLEDIDDEIIAQRAIING